MVSFLADIVHSPSLTIRCVSRRQLAAMVLMTCIRVRWTMWSKKRRAWTILRCCTKAGRRGCEVTAACRCDDMDEEAWHRTTGQPTAKPVSQPARLSVVPGSGYLTRVEWCLWRYTHTGKWNLLVQLVEVYQTFVTARVKHLRLFVCEFWEFALQCVNGNTVQ